MCISVPLEVVVNTFNVIPSNSFHLKSHFSHLCTSRFSGDNLKEHNVKTCRSFIPYVLKGIRGGRVAKQEVPRGDMNSNGLGAKLA